MRTLDYRTAGESHGKALTVLIEGLPAGVRDPSRARQEAEFAAGAEFTTRQTRVLTGAALPYGGARGEIG